jgi:transcriptional regulator with XRE-family HTH domain
MRTAAELLVEARRAAGLSQASIARRADIPRSVLNAYEHGNRQPGANALIAILRAAGFDLHLKRLIDLERNARILGEILDLAEQLRESSRDVKSKRARRADDSALPPRKI